MRPWKAITMSTCGCDDSCNSDCACGSTHHHCGCPCHDTPDGLSAAHQHAERRATHWLAEYQRLSAEVGRVPGTCETPDETRQLRAVVEAMRPIVEAALAWGDVGHLQIDDDDTDVDLGVAIEKNRKRLGVALAALDSREPAADSVSRIGNLLTADEWRALRAMSDALAANRSRPLPGSRDRAAAISAVSKLFAANAGRRV